MAENGIKNGSQLAKSMNMDRSEAVYRLLRDDTNKPSFEFLQGLIDVLPKTDFKWLISGVETILSYKDVNTGNKTALNSFEEPPGNYKKAYKSEFGIPLVGTMATAGFYNNSHDITEQDIQGRYVVPDFERVDFMLRVVGNSMYPKYTSGDVVACRIIQNMSFIQWNRPYLIAAGEQGLLIKRLMPNPDADLINLISDNPDYPPVTCKRSDIHGLALIVGTIRLE